MHRNLTTVKYLNFRGHSIGRFNTVNVSNQEIQMECDGSHADDVGHGKLEEGTWRHTTRVLPKWSYAS